MQLWQWKKSPYRLGMKISLWFLWRQNSPRRRSRIISISCRRYLRQIVSFSLLRLKPACITVLYSKQYTSWYRNVYLCVYVPRRYYLVWWIAFPIRLTDLQTSSSMPTHVHSRTLTESEQIAYCVFVLSLYLLVLIPRLRPITNVLNDKT